MKLLIELQDSELTQEVTNTIYGLAKLVASIKASISPNKLAHEPAPTAKPAPATAAAVVPYAENVPEPPPDESTPPRDESSTPVATQKAPTSTKARTYTAVEIRAASVAAKKKHGAEPIKAILAVLGVSGLTALTPEQYGEFMEKLEGLDNAG
jgi:hypothetical protein